jgi:hypothetical protein
MVLLLIKVEKSYFPVLIWTVLAAFVHVVLLAAISMSSKPSQVAKVARYSAADCLTVLAVSYTFLFCQAIS